MSTLVVAEHDNAELRPVTLSVVAAAQAIGTDFDVLVAGAGCAAVAEEAAKIGGARKVLLADNAAYEYALAENMSALVAELASDYDHVLTAHTTTGKNFLPRVAALLDTQMVSDIIGVESPDTFLRPIYAGNAIATVKSNDAKKVISVRGTGFDPAPADGGSATIEAADAAHDAGVSTFIGEEIAKSERPELTAASVVISGGRGMQNGENFSLLEGIADKLGAAIGASRAAVDAGFVPNDMQVGQTGKIVAPDLYIAVGISGAIQHLAGMKDSKVIVAINKDEDAPIFQVADYGLVADLFQALPELEAEASAVSAVFPALPELRPAPGLYFSASLSPTRVAHALGYPSERWSLRHRDRRGRVGRRHRQRSRGRDPVGRQRRQGPVRRPRPRVGGTHRGDDRGGRWRRVRL